ncbi:cupin domain-containing protein, partial [Klebsiella pneumoniae]
GMVFLPRSLPHTLTADEGNDATLLCATVEIGQQAGSPLALALPEVVVLPFRKMPPLHPALELLFAEFATAGSGRQTALERLLEYIIILVLR